MRRSQFGLTLMMLASAALAAPLAAQTYATQNVASTAGIYRNPDGTGLQQGTAPTAYALNGGTGRVLAFSSVVGSWGCNFSAIYSADGFDSGGGSCAGSATTINSANSISGVNAPGRTMFLVGLFLDANNPSGLAPSPYNYAGGYGQATYSGIALNQVFFIGDGRTGDVFSGLPQAGGIQQFLVPGGATRLILGVADAFNFNGDPSFYDDNVGNLTASFSISASTQPPTTAPEPSTYALMVAGLAAIGFAARRRNK
ncbi:MAG: PEP-CTERM sorting domain-containing protein [Gemmatimonadaceae bacterium]